MQTDATLLDFRLPTLLLVVACSWELLRNIWDRSNVWAMTPNISFVPWSQKRSAKICTALPTLLGLRTMHFPRHTARRFLAQHSVAILEQCYLCCILYLPNCSSKLSFRIFAGATNIFYASNNLHNLDSVMNEEFK